MHDFIIASVGILCFVLLFLLIYRIKNMPKTCPNKRSRMPVTPRSPVNHTSAIPIYICRLEGYHFHVCYNEPKIIVNEKGTFEIDGDPEFITEKDIPELFEAISKMEHYSIKKFVLREAI